MMNEQLQQTINDILTQSMQALNDGAEWLAGEIPDVIRQLLMFNAVEALLVAVLCTLFIVTYIFALVKTITHENFDFEDPAWGAPTLIGGLMGGGISTIFMFEIFDSLIELIKIWIAPKLYLLEYAASLVK
jgi:hypothetical protein